MERKGDREEGEKRKKKKAFSLLQVSGVKNVPVVELIGGNSILDGYFITKQARRRLSRREHQQKVSFLLNVPGSAACGLLLLCVPRCHLLQFGAIPP